MLRLCNLYDLCEAVGVVDIVQTVLVQKGVHLVCISQHLTSKVGHLLKLWD